jgi:hypothetical protein
MRKCRSLISLLIVEFLYAYRSAGSGEEDGEESYDDLRSKRTLEECEGGTAAGRDREGSDSDDSDDSDAPQDDQAQAAQAARPEHLQNGQVSITDPIE